MIDQFAADPSSDCAASALAETALRERSSDLEELLAEKSAGREYSIATAIRLAAAVGDVIEPLEWLLRVEPKETFWFNSAYWVPAVLRRIERDANMTESLVEAAESAPSASARLSALCLLGLGSPNNSKVRSVLESAVRSYEAEIIPVIAFDVTTESFRLAAQALRELIN